MAKKLVSIIIPAYCEENNIGPIYLEIEKEFSLLKDSYNYEIIFINDGSFDNSWNEIEKLAEKYKEVKGINLSRNFGKELSITAGIEEASGDCIITIDCDGQHPISEIKNFLLYWEKGFDIVYNKRPINKGANFFKRLSSKLFYKIFNTISEFKLEQGATDYRLLDRKVADYFLQFNEKNRLYRGLVDWLGFNKKALVFDSNSRYNSQHVGYSYRKLFRLAVNSMTSFSLFPLKVVGYLGAFITSFSIFLLIVILIDKISIDYFSFSNLSIMVVLNTILMGIVLVSLGFIALYVANIHEEVLRRPMYIIKDKLNLK